MAVGGGERRATCPTRILILAPDSRTPKDEVRVNPLLRPLLRVDWIEQPGGAPRWCCGVGARNPFST